MTALSKRKVRDEKRRAQVKSKFRAEKQQSRKTFREQQEVAALDDAITAGAPAHGSNPMALDQAAPGSYSGAKTFEELPLSQYTKAAMKEAGYVNLTAIQRAALPHALAGRDILGAAKTGSGKTLCFLVPLIEKLYRARWTKLDGLGALVLTPTRELALQIFEELVKIGRRHEFSAGLLIGGKAVAEEASRVNAMNILVATPGRLLQHMDETPGFEPSNLQLLVLDEADRILDMGFAATLDAILANLPAEGRQTLLFSATQTKSVKDLARLSLEAPEYLSVHSEAATPTPLKLTQAYMVVGLGQKMDVLWGFLKSHLTAKTIVFLSTCKQVRFAYEAFRKLRPGTPLRCLHGGMKQGKRLGVFEAFNAPSSGGGGGVLFATDIAARGLDFPSVDWVVQADCPEDVAAYIHRVGRTARYTATGRALLLLLPSEKDGMLQQLQEAKVPLKQLKHNPAKVSPISPALSALLSKNAELKSFAQSALVAYGRSVFLQPNKAVFDAAALPLDEYAESLGLLAAPQLKFLKRVGKKVVQEVVVGTGGGDAAAAAGDAAAAAAVEEQQQERKRRRLSPEPDTAAAGQLQQQAQRQGVAGSEGDLDAEGGSDLQRQEAAAATAAAAAAGSKKRKQPPPAAAAADEEEEVEDDFLRVKQRNVFEIESDAADDDAPDEAGNQQEPTAADLVAAAAAAAAAAKPKKRKKQRIKLGAVSGQRVVFDDEGEQVDPLELLASTGFGGKSQPGKKGRESGENGRESGDADSAEADRLAVAADGLHVVAEAAGDRFARAAELMVARDRSDKAALAALRRQAKHDKKLRRKAAAQQDAADMGGGVALGEGYSSGEDASDAEEGRGGYRSSSSGYDSGSDGDDAPHAVAAGRGSKHTHGRHQQQQQRQRRGGEAAGSDSDGGEAEPDVAYIGMARKSDKQQQQMQRQQAKQQPAGSVAAGAAAAAPQQQQQGLSLAEQEAMALQLLAAKPW